MKRVRDSDPERLELADPALKRALSSLADDGPSTAELQRMRQRLMGVVEAPSTSRAPLLNLVRSPFGALLIGLGLAAAIGLVRYKQERDAAQEASANAPRVLAPAESARLADSQPTAARDGADELAPPVGSPEPTQANAARPLLKRSRHAIAASSHALSAHELAAPSGESSAPAESAHGSLATGAEPASVPDAPRATPSAGTKVAKATAPRSETLVTPTEAASASSVSAPSPSPVRPEAPPAARSPAPLDEASLLQRARQLAASEPEASLRLLSEHKRRFSHGMLTPEREVLAIELLRALSRRGEAARRLEEFRRDFPDSVYLQRLEP